MEQTTIIAVASLVISFLTAFLTAGVTIWSKRIDAKHKLNEHQFSLRSVYVNKKIEAAQDAVTKLIAVMYRLQQQNNGIILFLKKGRISKEDADKINKRMQKYTDIIDASREYSSLYFPNNEAYAETKNIYVRINELELEVSIIIDRAHKDEISGNVIGNAEDVKEVNNNYKEIMRLNDAIITILNGEIDKISAEMAKYDIV